MIRLIGSKRRNSLRNCDGLVDRLVFAIVSGGMWALLVRHAGI